MLERSHSGHSTMDYGISSGGGLRHIRGHGALAKHSGIERFGMDAAERRAGRDAQTLAVVRYRYRRPGWKETQETSMVVEEEIQATVGASDRKMVSSVG